jgi:uncharacterized RDD family membrane protein YckC
VVPGNRRSTASGGEENVPVAGGSMLGYRPSLEPAHRYSTFWPRLGAAVVDGLLFLPVGLLDSVVFARVDRGAPLVAWFIFSSFVGLCYSVLLHGLTGQTLGKMITGVRVIDLSENALSLRQAVLRDSVPIVLTVVAVWFGMPSVLHGVNPRDVARLDVSTYLSSFAALAWGVAELVTMLWNDKRRAVHDFIAQSVVVRTR